MGRTKGALNKTTLLKRSEEDRARREALAREGGSGVAGAMPGSGFAQATPGQVMADETLELAGDVAQGSGGQDSGFRKEEPRARSFAEYPVDGKKWRVEDGGGVFDTFGISADDLARWHGALSGQERAWRIVRMAFGIAPLLMGEEDKDFIRPHSDEEIELAFQERGESENRDAIARREPRAATINVRDEIAAAVEFWRRWSRANPVAPEASPLAAKEDAVTSAERDAVLRKYGFEELSEEWEKGHAYGRVCAMRHKIEDEEGGVLVQEAIRIELAMKRIDMIVAKVEGEAIKDVTKAQSARSVSDGYQKRRDTLHTQHLELMKAMNATQVQNLSAEKKRDFKDCLGGLMAAVQLFESNGDNRLIDGMFTASEIRILCTPMSLRPPQYRPDIPILISDALKSRNLWDPEYQMLSMPRDFYRRFTKSFRESLTNAEMEIGSVADMEDEDVGSDSEVAEKIPETAGAEQAAAAVGGMAHPAMARRGGRAGEDIGVG